MTNNTPKAIIAFRVASVSTPGKLYKVTVYDNGEMSCRELSKEGKEEETGCMANEMNKFCRHKKIAYLRLRGLVKLIEDVQKKKAEKKNEKR